MPTRSMPNKCRERKAERKINELHGRTMDHSHQLRVCMVWTNVQHKKIDSIEIENGKHNKKKENGQNRYHSAGAFPFVSFHLFVFAFVSAKRRHGIGIDPFVLCALYFIIKARRGVCPHPTNLCAFIFICAAVVWNDEYVRRPPPSTTITTIKEKNKSIFLTFIRLNTVRYFRCCRHEDPLSYEYDGGYRAEMCVCVARRQS